MADSSMSNPWRCLLVGAAIAAIAASMAAGCTAGPTVGSDKVLVAASIAPLADFTRQVGGSSVEVITLMPPGASPHIYEPTPSQVGQVAKAGLLVLNGVGLEYWSDKLLQSAGNPGLIVVDTSEGIEIMEADADEPLGNPHIWLDPQQAIVQVGHIRNGLIRADPRHADDYRANADRLIAQLQELDRELTAEIATWQTREFIAFHPAWIYFARRYNLVQAAVIEESPGREPSPADVADIVATARRIKATAIFAEPQFSPKVAETIAAESGAAVLLLDPLGSSLDDSSYVNMMRYNVAQMARALR